MGSCEKHLHELLTQDQEPFQLHNYIADKRRSYHLNKPKHLISNKLVNPTTNNNKSSSSSSSRRRCSLYKQACFSSFQDSPDFLNSPIKNNHSGGHVLHIPPITAAGLLEAAIKIQKQQQQSSKSKSKNVAGLLGSILKKLKDKNTTKPHQNVPEEEKFVDNSKEKYEMEIINNNNNTYSSSSRRISSAGWSESNTAEEEEDNIDTISSCTTSKSDFYNQQHIIHDFVLPSSSSSDQPHFCLSPFRFALHTYPSVVRRSPEFLSPSTSPCRHPTQEYDDQPIDNLQKNQPEEEDEKDQCSPVSVLDLPFEDDERDIRVEEEEEEEEDEDDYDLECSYALMQKAKIKLLEKLRRFERLAELEPIELEKRMLQGYEEDEDDDDDYVDEYEEHEGVDDLIVKIFSISSPCHPEKVPRHMKRLVVDLIGEEKKNEINNRNEVMVTKMVCKRLDSWQEVESNTIDMMVELVLRRKLDDGWKSYKEEEVGDRAKEIELSIFDLLMEEISEELASH